MSKARLFFIFVFVAVGLTLVVLAIFLLGKKQRIFEDTFLLNAQFQTVVGLQEGAPVRLSGIDIGVVREIRLPEVSGGKVVVVMGLDKKSQHLIKKDSETVIETEGLVGNKIVSIIGGSTSAKTVVDGDMINSHRPVDLTAILESFEETAQYMRGLTQSISQITSHIQSGQGTLGKLVYDKELYQQMVDVTNKGEVIFKTLGEEASRLEQILTFVTSALDSMITYVESGQGNLGSLIFRDDIYKLVKERIPAITDSINLFIADIRTGQGTLGRLVSSDSLYNKLQISMDQLIQFNKDLQQLNNVAQIGLIRFAEDMEALKHNWLFKGYFEKRGFWNKTEFEAYYERKTVELKQQAEELKKREEALKKLEKSLPTKK